MGIPQLSNMPSVPHRFLSSFASGTPAFLLARACLHGRADDFSAMMSDKAIWPNIQSKSGETLLMALLRSNKNSVPDWQNKLRLLLAHPLTAVNMQGDEGDTPLHIAAAQGDDDIVDILLRCKADKSLRNVNGKTPADVASTAALQERLSTGRGPVPRQRDMIGAETETGGVSQNDPSVSGQAEVTQAGGPQVKKNRDELWLSKIVEATSGSVQVTPRKMSKLLLEVLKDGDHPKTVRFLIQNGADATMRLKAAPTFVNGMFGVPLSPVWEWALAKRRKESFREICLWTAHWHKGNHYKDVTDGIRRLQDEGMLWRIAGQIKQKKTGKNAPAESFDWVTDAAKYLTARYSYSDEKNIQAEFSDAARSMSSDYYELAALYAESVTPRRTWLGIKKNGKAYETPLANMLLHALLKNDFVLADDILRYDIKLYPTDGVREAFTRAATPDMTAWLSEHNLMLSNMPRNYNGGYVP